MYSEYAAGRTYREIGEAHGVSMRAAQQRIRNHAIRNGLPRTLRRPDGGRGALAYQLHAEGKSWSAVSQIMGLASRLGVRSMARDHAKANGLAWPIQTEEPTHG